MAVFLRESPKHYPAYFDEYRIWIARACQRCEPEYGVMGIVGFLYASVKDSLKDEKLSIKRHRREVMAIGRLVYLEEKKFQEAVNARSTVSVNNMTAEDINKLAGV